MTATLILDDLRGRACALTSNGDRLKIDAPLGVLTDEDRQAIRIHKAELLVLVDQAGEKARQQVAPAKS